jgi:sporulation protein YlmC with PRC-barrel domain
VHTGAVGKRFSPTTVERRERLVDRDERLKELDDKYEDYAIYDNAGEKIGKVDDVFINETDREEYIGVKMGLFGLSGKTLIPMEIARVDEQERRIEVAASKDQAKNAPHYHDDDDIDHEFEARIREHFGLER